MRIDASSPAQSPGFSTTPTGHSERDNSLKSLESLPLFQLRRIDSLSPSLQTLIKERQTEESESSQPGKGTRISLNWSAVSGIENGTSPSSLRDLVTNEEKEEEEEKEPKTLLDLLIERLETQIEQTEQELEQLENEKGEAGEKKREVLRDKLAGLTSALAKAREEKIKEDEEMLQQS